MAITNPFIESKLKTPEEVALALPRHVTSGSSGFTPAGCPKLISPHHSRTLPINIIFPEDRIRTHYVQVKPDKIKGIVRFVSHTDHNEHSTMIIVKEQRLTDIREYPPKKRTELIISKCAHPILKTGSMK
ncbi:hypothetical protein [Leptospira ilyithenensis]|uniref:hypothetical protein n=1 Tax=Leptospira ilyithenensis TaxID=2484901 RepID=UPI001FE987FF|nr:hypothetical protein [Leptospira ilyithenensis]